MMASPLIEMRVIQLEVSLYQQPNVLTCFMMMILDDRLLFRVQLQDVDTTDDAHDYDQRRLLRLRLLVTAEPDHKGTMKPEY